MVERKGVQPAQAGGPQWRDAVRLGGGENFLLGRNVLTEPGEDVVAYGEVASARVGGVDYMPRRGGFVSCPTHLFCKTCKVIVITVAFPIVGSDAPRGIGIAFQ